MGNFGPDRKTTETTLNMGPWTYLPTENHAAIVRAFTRHVNYLRCHAPFPAKLEPAMMDGIQHSEQNSHWISGRFQEVKTNNKPFVWGLFMDVLCWPFLTFSDQMNQHEVVHLLSLLLALRINQLWRRIQHEATIPAGNSLQWEGLWTETLIATKQKIDEVSNANREGRSVCVFSSLYHRRFSYKLWDREVI